MQLSRGADGAKFAALQGAGSYGAPTGGRG